MRISLFPALHTNTHICTHTHTYTRAHAHTHIHAHIYIHTYTLTLIDIYMYTHEPRADLKGGGGPRGHAHPLQTLGL